MDSKNTSDPIGVVGAGSFGTAIANLLAENCEKILLYVRDPKKAKSISKSRICSDQKLSDKVEITNNIQKLGEECNVIFPVVPSANFRDLMKQLGPYLRPFHILIHGTKGFDLQLIKGKPDKVTPANVKTMSEVIKEESSVVRVGCLAGPNLAKEISENKPAATVIASQFEEVVAVGKSLLKNERFLIYGSSDLIGTELCGILKNSVAVGAGMLSGLNLGENARALFISRGLVEMINLGKELGGNVRAFLGLAGVGDLIATCGSSLSRNFTVGHKLAEGMSIKKIMDSMEEVAEGIKTIDIVHHLSNFYGVRSVINEMLYKIINKKLSVKDAQHLLMKMPFRQEVEFLD
ncbi:MAG: NAD(P)-dependent glycerol-3-phosphate dehydrogenase [Cytophagales bacterium]|nr:NAD(P)-dependent glycerol-3-phosphate dehydrogenase [Cytophagales bacterium]